MAFRDLRRKTAEIDEQHRESMRTIDENLGELHFGTDAKRAASRRSFLTRAAAGGAIAFGATVIPVSSMIPEALAQETKTGGSTPGSTPGTTKAASSGSAKAPKVEGQDLTVVVFAQTIELAAVAAYKAILATGKLPSPVAETARTFSQHHGEHAAALATWAGSEALNTANAKLVTELTPKINAATDVKSLATIAYDLEEGAAATYEYALGLLQGWDVAGAVSTILPVEGQHAVAWSEVIEPDPTQWATQIKTYVPNFQTDSGAFKPSAYPTA